MKRKLLFMMLCIIGCMTWITSHAQEDVTDTYLTNAGLTDLTGWTIDPGFGGNGYTAWNTSGDVPVIEFYHTWSANAGAAIGSTKTFNFSQTATLPAGDYRIAVNAFYREGNGNGTNTKAYIYAGEKQQYVVGLPAGGLNAYTGGNDLLKAANAFSQGAYSNEFDFTLDEETEIEMGFHGYIDTYCSWCILGPVKLYKYNLEDYINDYRLKVSEAEALYESPMNQTVLQALQDAVQDPSSFTNKEQVLTATQELNIALNNAKTSVAAYATADVAGYLAKMKSVLDNTNVYTSDAYNTHYATVQEKYNNGELTDEFVATLTPNGAYSTGWHATNHIDDVLLSTWTVGGEQCVDYNKSLYINTWSTEGNTDGSEFYTPFFEYWTGDANSLNANTFTSTMVGLEPNTDYSVTIRARVRQTNNQTKVENGITMQVGEGAAVDISSGSLFGSTPFYIGNFSAMGKTDADGNLVTTITVSENSNISWLSFYNVNYTEGEDLSAYIADYEFAFATATSYTTKGMDPNLKPAFVTAVAAATLADPDNATKEELIAAKEALEAAMTDDVKNSVAELCGSSINNWTTTGNNGAFHVNTWSGEGASDGSNMITPFLENWIARGTALTDADISYTLTSQTPGYYKVNALIRSLNEAGGATPAGTFIFANDNIERAYNGSACTNGVYDTPTVYGLVGEDGKLVIGVKIIQANVNWVSFKDFNVEYVGTELTDAIAANQTEEKRTFQYNADAQAEEDEAVNALTDELTDANYTAAGQAIEAAYRKLDVVPETINIYEGEDDITETGLTLNAEKQTATLTAVVGPEGASQDVEWNSDNTDVATITAEGELTAVLPGTATIKATSSVTQEVYAETTITVEFAETEVPEVTYVNDGAKRTYSALGENIIKNGSFEYPDGFYNWTQAKDFTTKITSAKFKVNEEDGNKYLVGTVNEGAAGEGSLGVAWPIEAGKSYVFSYRVKNINANSGNQQYLITSLTNTKGTETKVLGTPTVNKGEWATVKYAFTNDEEYQFVQVKFRWLNNQFGFDDFYLCEATTTEVGNVDYITENVPSGNIGTNVFQYNQTNIEDAQGLTQATPDNQYTGATVAQVQEAYDLMMSLNQPNASSRYYLVVATEGHALNGNAVLVSLGATSANNPTGYSFNASYSTPDQNLAQAWTFVPVDGKLNTYKMYYTDENNEAVYLTYGSLNGSAAGWKSQQIQGTKVLDNAGDFQILGTSTDNVINIRNTVYSASTYNGTIACQGGGALYTESGNADFTVQLAEPAVIEVAIAEGAYATRMFPFKPEIPSGVVCYEVEEMNGTSLVLKEVSDPQANTPYILYSEEAEIGEDVEGYGTATSLEPVEKGLLVGTLADENTVKAGNYVLQTLTNGQKFYKVASDITNYPAYRAYLKGSEVGDGVKEIGLAGDDTPTGINAISEGGFNFSNIEGVYDLSGAKIGRLQKGTNVVRMKDGSVRKVLVK